MNFLKFIFKTIKVFLLSIVIVLISYKSNVLQNKVENINLNKSLDLLAMSEIDWDGQELASIPVIGSRVGSLTGYAADCPLCSGFLGCSPHLDVRDKTTTYQDEVFGTVNIVAASKNNLPCGSIIKFSSDRISSEDIYAIVLDRGVSGNAIDLLTDSQEKALNNIGRSTITYDVLRNGWTSE